MVSRRMQRINELLLQEISRFVTAKQEPGLGIITFLEVRTTDDLMTARVFYSVFGGEKERRHAAEVLKDLTPELRKSMRRLESLKRIPELEFEFDSTPARAARVFEILDQIKEETKGSNQPGPVEDSPHS